MCNLSPAKWLFIFFFIFISYMVEAEENSASHFNRETPVQINTDNKKCPTQYSFESLEVEACQAGSGEMTLYIYNKNDHTQPLFIKKLGDAYYIMPVLFKKNLAVSNAVLIVDHGAEFSYGAMIFSLEKRNIEYLGIIDLVLKQGDGSLISHINLEQDFDGKLIFHFDTDMYMPTKQGIYKKITKAKALYQYDNVNGLKPKTQ